MTDTDGDEVPEIVRAFSEYLMKSALADMRREDVEALAASDEVLHQSELAEMLGEVMEASQRPDEVELAMRQSLEALGARMHERYVRGMAQGRVEMHYELMSKWFALLQDEHG